MLESVLANESAVEYELEADLTNAIEKLDGQELKGAAVTVRADPVSSSSFNLIAGCRRSTRGLATGIWVQRWSITIACPPTATQTLSFAVWQT